MWSRVRAGERYLGWFAVRGNGVQGVRLSVKIVSGRKRQKARLRRSSQESRRKHSRMLNQGCRKDGECRERGNLHGGPVAYEIPRRIYETREKSKDMPVSWRGTSHPYHMYIWGAHGLGAS